MVPRRYTRTKDGKTHPYYAPVESVRTEAGPRQHVVAHLGELDHDQGRRRRRTVAFHDRQAEDRPLRPFPDAESVPLPEDPDVVQVRLDSVGWTDPRRFGDVRSGLWLWKSLHLHEGVDRHVPQGEGTVRPADIVAIEVIHRPCAPSSESALAEPWHRSTALQDLLGAPDSAATEDRPDRTSDRSLKARQAIGGDLKDRFGRLSRLDDDPPLDDPTGPDFEGPAEEDGRARRGYPRDHRGDCPRVVLALIATRDGPPPAHLTPAGDAQDLQAVEAMVETIEARFGRSRRVRVLDRGRISEDTLKSLGRSGRRHLPAARRGASASFARHRRGGGGRRLPDDPDVEVEPLKGGRGHYLPARSRPRRPKGRAIRRRRRRGLARASEELKGRIGDGRLESRDESRESVGRLEGRFPEARPSVTMTVTTTEPARASGGRLREGLRAAPAGDGASLLRRDRGGRSAPELRETSIQLTVVGRAARALRSELLRRPVRHPSSGRTQAHVTVCVPAYALAKAPDHLAERAGLAAEIPEPDPHRGPAAPKPRPMTPGVLLRESGQIVIGDIEPATTDGPGPVRRRVARPMGGPRRILAAPRREIPERWSPGRISS